MALPNLPLTRGSVEVGDVTVEYRALSRKEALRVGMAFKDDPDAAETYILACGCDVSEDEALAWRNSTSAEDAGKVVDAIIYASGLASPKAPAA